MRLYNRLTTIRGRTVLRFTSSWVVAAFLLPMFVANAQSLSASAMPRITVLPSTAPSTITAPNGQCPTKSGQGLVHFHLKVTGMYLSASNKITKKPVSGEARIVAYLDSLPKNAYTKYTAHASTWLSSEGQRSFPLCFGLPVLHGRKGKHTILLTLAKSTGVLYKNVPPARFSLKVR